MALGQYGNTTAIADNDEQSLSDPHIVCTAASIVTDSAPADVWKVVHGPVRVAAELARLGVRVTVNTRLGRDSLGRRIAEALASEGVDLTADAFTDEPTLTDNTAAVGFPLIAETPHVTARVCLVGGVATFQSEGDSQRTYDALTAPGSALKVYVPAVDNAPLDDQQRARIQNHIDACDVLVIEEDDATAIAPTCDALEWSLEQVAAQPGPELVIIVAGSEGTVIVNRHAAEAEETGPNFMAETLDKPLIRDVVAGACLHALISTGCTREQVSALRSASLLTLSACGVKSIVARVAQAAGTSDSSTAKPLQRRPQLPTVRSTVS